VTSALAPWSASLVHVGEDVRVVDVRLEELVRLHHLRLVRLAYVVCNDASEAEDLVAEAYARCWPKLARGGIDDPLAYLRRAVVNGARSWGRHRFVIRREELRRRVAPDSEREARRVEDRDVLAAALASLPVAQRAVVALRFLEDLSEVETAAVLGVPVGTVKSRAARALETLRGAVEERSDA
jgi:RNA polymerase sigma-70 factor (sigma-E family)